MDTKAWLRNMYYEVMIEDDWQGQIITHLTHSGPVTSYGNMDLGQHWLR